MIREDLKDPRLGFITVTFVDVAEDLSHAKVYVSVLGSSQEVKGSVETLNHAAGYMRGEIGKRLHLRHAPEIVFKYDSSIEHGAHIAKLIREVNTPGQVGVNGTGKEESHDE